MPLAECSLCKKWVENEKIKVTYTVGKYTLRACADCVVKAGTLKKAFDEMMSKKF